MRGVMLGRKDSGSVGDLLASGICILAMCSAMLGFFDCMELLKQKNQVSQVAREYISRLGTVPVISSIRSASVDLPWSICAIIEKFLI